MEKLNFNKYGIPFLLDTPAFFQELTDNISKDKGKWILTYPQTLLKDYLVKVAERAAELNDPKLNILMLSMKLYEVPHYEITKMIEHEERRIEEQQGEA